MFSNFFKKSASEYKISMYINLFFKLLNLYLISIINIWYDKKLFANFYLNFTIICFNSCLNLTNFFKVSKLKSNDNRQFSLKDCKGQVFGVPR